MARGLRAHPSDADHASPQGGHLTNRPPDNGRLLTAPFLLVSLSTLAYFSSIGVLIPVLPLYVEGPLGGGGVAVGIAVGAFSVSATVFRPFMGKLGDRSGRRLLVVGGAGGLAVSVAAYSLVDTLVPLIALRLGSGIGEAAQFVGAATAVQDMAPPTRRAEAASYFSVAVYTGLALGPVLGEAVLAQHGYDAVWFTAAAVAAAGSVLGWWAPGPCAPESEGLEEAPVPFRILHPAAVLPGVVLFLGLIGYAGFTAFVPLYVDEIGVEGTRYVFVLYASVVVTVRLLGARIPDRVGPRQAGSVALSAIAIGLCTIAWWKEPVGLYVGTAIFGLGASLLFPVLMALVVGTAPAAERSSAVGTFSVFFDLSAGLGTLALGVVVAAGGEAAAFLVGATTAVVGLGVLRVWVSPARALAR